VIALLPVWLLATALLWLPFKIYGGVSFVFFAVMLMLLGVVLFSRPVQRLVFARLMGARSPSPHEDQRLQPAWRDVAQANHFSPQRFVLAVADGNDINAFACGGHLLVVSSYAIENLNGDQLSGVLAHELSHHMGGHTVALTVAQWMSLPVIAFARFGFFLQKIAQAAVETFAKNYPRARIFGRLIAELLRAIAWIFQAGLIAAQKSSNLVGRASEYRADTRALEMGFGHELLSALKQVANDTATAQVDAGSLVFSSHPPARTRVARLEAMLRPESITKRELRRQRAQRGR
jgi:Zn-dependent protease with chaperone function